MILPIIAGVVAAGAGIFGAIGQRKDASGKQKIKTNLTSFKQTTPSNSRPVSMGLKLQASVISLRLLKPRQSKRSQFQGQSQTKSGSSPTLSIGSTTSVSGPTLILIGSIGLLLKKWTGSFSRHFRMLSTEPVCGRFSRVNSPLLISSG
jgi:hypothetical protein